MQNSVVRLCCYSYSDYLWKATALQCYLPQEFTDVGDEMCLVLILSLWDPKPSWLLFNELKNKGCWTIARNRSIHRHPGMPGYKNTIDCACLQSYIRQILPSSRYYKEKAAASLGLASNYKGLIVWNFATFARFPFACGQFSTENS